MVPLAELWLPVLLSAVFVFLASSVLHMVTPWHRRDYKRLKDEAGIMDALRPHRIPPGQYMFPSCDSFAEAQTEEGKRKFDQGPVGFLTMYPDGLPKMGLPMAAWFGYSLVVALFTAYLAGHALEPGAEYGQVHQVAGTAGILGFAFWHVPVSIWKGVEWSVTARFVLDGVLYGLVVGGTFGWLWPAAA
jgi:hypothetical protein